MKRVTQVLVVGLIAFTALAMAINPEFKNTVVVSLGPLPIYIFDALLLMSTGAFFWVISLRVPTDPAPGNRMVLRLTGAYVLYQAVVVIPVAVLLHDVSPGTAYGGVTARLGLILIPFFYYAGLHFARPERVVALVNAAALGLLVYAVYRYVFVGAEGVWEAGVLRLRVLWGGSTLLFGWLALTGMFLERSALRAYVLGIAGLAGVAFVNHRSGYIAIMIGIVAQVLLSRRITRRLVAVAVVVVVGGAVVASLSPTIRDSAAYSLTTMFNARSDSNAWDRVERSSLAWDYVKVHPLGDYVWTRQFYLVDLGDQGFEPHNFVVGALNKQGWIAAILLFLLIGTVLWVGWAARARSRLGRVMTAYVLFYLVYCLFNTNFDATENVTLFALAVAMILYANRTPDDAAEAEPATDEGGTPLPAEAGSPGLPQSLDAAPV